MQAALAAGCIAGHALQVHVSMAPKPPHVQSVAPLLYGQFSPAIVHMVPLFGAVPGHVVPPPLLLLPAVVVVPPAPELELLVVAVDPPAPLLAVPDAPAPVLAVDSVLPPPVPVEPAGPELALPPDPLVDMFWLTVPPQACTMATNASPKEAMAALLFMMILS
jgi:hypothetical protein